MTASDVYCDFCDLPMAQCVHGQPPPPPPPPPLARTGVSTASTAGRSKPGPRRRTTSPSRAAAGPDKPVTRRWTTPEVFKPLIIAVLREAGGELEADELFLELEIAAGDRLLPGDSETTPEGELRWRYAARRARVALIDEGLMTKGRPGVWTLA